MRNASSIFLIVALAVSSLPGLALAQATDVAWNARLTALEEERAAQAGVAVSIVFDDSGSMSERNKITMAKQAFRSWVEKAPESYRFGLTAINGGQLVALKPNDKAEILAAVDRLRARGTTPLADTIAKVAGEIRQRRAAGALYERQVAVILTDGEDSTDRGVRGVEQEIKKLRADRVEVVAFGYQGEGDYMRASATHYFSPENGEDIQRGLNSIAAEIGDTSDIAVDEPTLARMKNVSAAVPVASTPTVPPRPPTPTPTPIRRTMPRTTKSSGGFFNIVAVVVVVIVVSLLRRR